MGYSAGVARGDLDRADEIARFEALKPRLATLWSTIFPGDDDHYTSVVVPSLTLDQSELRKIEGATFYEERLLFLLIRLRNPRAHMVYITSQPIHPLVLEYYFQLLSGVPASHARARLTLLCAHDASPRPLTQKILERPRLVERIREGIPDPARAYLSVFNSTPLERTLAVRLDLPLNGVDPTLAPLGTKSGSRKVFRAAGVPFPAGREDLRGEADVVAALADLKKEKPELRRAVVKLNESFSGEGNALFTYPEGRTRVAVRDALRRLRFAVPDETRQTFFEKLSRMGGIVEEFLEARHVASPSVQLRINPKGQVLPVATHDQILGGPSGQTFLGCRFPARDGYRGAIQGHGLAIGEVLARHGVVSRFSIDFLATSEDDDRWQVHALEINLRMGGTTHPFLALRFLTGGNLDPRTGLFHSPSGSAKYYRSTDNLKSERYRGLLPEDLMEIVTENHLHYAYRTETGVLFHLIGALSEYGKVGLTAIGNSRGGGGSAVRPDSGDPRPGGGSPGVAAARTLDRRDREPRYEGGDAGRGGRSTTRSAWTRRNVSATWQFQHTGRWLVSTAGTVSGGISVDSRVIPSVPTSAGLWSCQWISPNGRRQYAHRWPAYHRARIVRTRQSCGAASRSPRAGLAAARALRPAGTVLQAEVRPAEGRVHRRVRQVQIHGHEVPRLRAGDEALAAQLQDPPRDMPQPERDERACGRESDDLAHVQHGILPQASAAASRRVIIRRTAAPMSFSFSVCKGNRRGLRERHSSGSSTRLTWMLGAQPMGRPFSMQAS